MITIASCSNIQEALSLQMALAASEIPSFIPDEATAQNAFFIGSEAGVRVQVAEEHVSEAQQIIKDTREVVADEQSKQDLADEKVKQDRAEEQRKQDGEEERV